MLIKFIKYSISQFWIIIITEFLVSIEILVAKYALYCCWHIKFDNIFIKLLPKLFQKLIY